MRKSDFRIRVSDILQASGQPQTEIFEIRREFRYKGSYVDFWIGVELCRRCGLSDLEKGLRSWKPVQEPVKEPAKEPELSEFIEITDFPVPVMVRRSDFRINATHRGGKAWRMLESDLGLGTTHGSHMYHDQEVEITLLGFGSFDRIVTASTHMGANSPLHYREACLLATPASHRRS